MTRVTTDPVWVKLTIVVISCDLTYGIVVMLVSFSKN